MKKLVTLAVVALVATMVSYAQSPVFVIDGQRVEKFDGSQLTGKKIISFNVNKVGDTELYSVVTDSSLPDNLKDKSYRVVGSHTEVYHQDAAAGKADKNKVTSEVSVISGQPLVVVDGEIYEGALSELKSDDIASISVYKPGSEVAKSYGEKGTNGVMKVFTKATIENKIFVLDGKRVTYKEIANIPVDKVAGITVLKRGSKEALAFGAEGKTHDIYKMTTK